MFMIAPVVCGTIGALIADKLGLTPENLDWSLVCAPWWFLSAAINSHLK